MRFFYFIVLPLICACLTAEKSSAQSTADDLLAEAIELTSSSDPTQQQWRCAGLILDVMVSQFADHDLAVSLAIGDEIEGLDLDEIEQQVGSENFLTGQDNEYYSDTAFSFIQDYPSIFSELCKELGAEVGTKVAEELLEDFLETVAGETFSKAVAGVPVSFAGLAQNATIEGAGQEIVVGYVAERLAVTLLDGYASATGAEVDSERIVSFASPTASMIVAMYMASGPAAPAATAGVIAFSTARGAALSSYAEDERFAAAAADLVAVDAFRKTAAQLRVEGRNDHAQEIDNLAQAILDDAAARAEESFAGKDGPVAARMLRDMGQVIHLLRLNRWDEAHQLRLNTIAYAEENAPGLLTPTANNFYERFFMIGEQHRADSARAYIELESLLQNIFEENNEVYADVAAAIAAAQTVRVTPDPAAPVEFSGVWTSEIVASADLGFSPCHGEDQSSPGCLRELGLSDAAIAFSNAFDGDYSGSTVAVSYRDTGATDLAEAQTSGASVYYTPVLLNGGVGFAQIPATRDLSIAFKDSTSRSFLSTHPDARSLSALSVVSHRLLSNGAQRFTLVEAINDGCRGCAVIGSAVSFLDIAPNGTLSRTPLGIFPSTINGASEATASQLLENAVLLQFWLNKAGYPAGEMDGYPGPATRSALMEFQAEHCLAVTGQPSRETLAALVSHSGFETPCQGLAPPHTVDALSPLLSGIYVDDLTLCNRKSVPFETVHLQQRIVRGTSITWGQEGGCEVTRTDIRDGVTLFKGTCFEGNTSYEARWRFDVHANNMFVDLGFEGQSTSPRQYTMCPSNSALRGAWSSWFAADTEEQTHKSVDLSSSSSTVASERAESSEVFTPERGSSLRRSLMDAIRPVAITEFGPPIQFLVDELSVANDLAYASVRARRPGGEAIDMAETPAYLAGRLYLTDPGTPEEFQAVLRRQSTGDWKVERVVRQPTEAWWLENCDEWQILFKSTCATGPATKQAAVVPSVAAPAMPIETQKMSRTEADQSILQCLAIKSDKERLSCYDRIASAQSALPTSEEAMRAFSDVFDMSAQEDFVTTAAMFDCELTSEHSHFNHFGNYTYTRVFHLDLSQVVSVRSGPSGGGFRSMNVRVAAGSEINMLTFQSEGFKPHQVDVGISPYTSNADLISRIRSILPTQSELRRDRELNIVYSYQHDQQSVLEAFRTLAMSCGGLL